MKYLAAALLLEAGCLFPSQDSHHLYACSSDSDCPASYECDAGQCFQTAAQSPADAGLCGGTVACDAGFTCDFGSCFPLCGTSCAGVCDQAANACVPGAACTGTGSCGDGGICTASVCVAPPTGAPLPDGGCGSLKGGVGGVLTITGNVALFPNDQSVAALSGGSVTFCWGDGGCLSGSISYADPFASYSIAGVRPGALSALVQTASTLPTYFPNLEIASNGTTLDLEAVVSPDQLQPFVSMAGAAPAPGQLVWVGQAATCDFGSYLNGYTVGLSATPAFLTYLDAGEFIALGAPYATTSYVMALPGEVLLKGTFTPPPFDGGTLAVALIYPNFSH